MSLTGCVIIEVSEQSAAGVPPRAGKGRMLAEDMVRPRGPFPGPSAALLPRSALRHLTSPPGEA
jgi:hypothetical protein